ncbi:DUF1566 domain-containing protein [Leptospira gomenensis]|uniref:DUF1566 domain-containing protein n=1 Tax=Leptospira gomenensis TaxID=2484974 RepID=A0A5F1YYL9_9LEPT|nr:DUF1566 domain-containing protein [Leptospira gomenensis]TGK29478.1 DUF1566 domain-containing protein [Leptospira gomenensis]TGK33619.1 DUF1566 domain-containing protein [Leptospira gomenensis]TGK44860.1 DUF1566 domain-containing protein [Leptospira gomenensis]TGK64481.1 DUF1566 domain-containing protein [Leptospira gomenensis]
MNKYSFFIIFLLSTFCIAHAPERPDPPYVILQYLMKSASSDQTPPPGDTTDPCGPSLSFSPAAVVDTGQTQCWNGAGFPLFPCPGAGHDGDYVNVPRARNFVGPTQHCVYPNDYTTLDAVHGLTWKTCAQGQTGADCSGGALTPISWDDASAGLPGSCVSLNGLNGGNGYAGKTDWRIPTAKELASIIHYSNNPHVETVQFPGMFTGNSYLSETTIPLSLSAWSINFSPANLGINTNLKNTPINLRCVSGNAAPATSYLDNSLTPPGTNLTILDRNTNLLWTKCSLGQVGTSCLGAANTSDWNGALSDCENLVLGGRNNWRLPNANELLSIVQFTTPGPSISSAFFPNTLTGAYWTSTTFDNDKSKAELISFNGGLLTSNDKSSMIYVRCVTNN